MGTVNHQTRTDAHQQLEVGTKTQFLMDQEELLQIIADVVLLIKATPWKAKFQYPLVN